MGEWWWRVPASPTSAPGGCRRGSPGKKKEKEVGRLLFCFFGRWRWREIYIGTVSLLELGSWKCDIG